MKKNTIAALATTLSCVSLVGCAATPYGGYSQGYAPQGLSSVLTPGLIQSGLGAVMNSGTGLPQGISSAISSVGNQLVNQGRPSVSPYYQRASYSQGQPYYQNQNGGYPNGNYPRGYGQQQTYQASVPNYFGY